jgi:hypothetical protein
MACTETADVNENVTVTLSLNFIIGCWGYTVDIEDRVS